MKTDELRGALDELAGDAPEVETPFGVVTRRARRDRVRNRGTALVAVACVVAVAAFGVSRRSSPEHIVVRNPNPPVADAAHLSWTRVAGPSDGINRIVTANGRTYALGSDNRGADVLELAADGHPQLVLHVARANDFVEINDLIGVHGSLVAVGTNVGRAAAWRSTDSGETWRSVPVEQPPLGTGPQGGGAPPYQASITRILASGGKLYALGPSGATPRAPCLRAAWTSTDGTAFALAPGDSPIACGGNDMADGPAGLVPIESGPAVAIIDQTGWPIGARDAFVAAIAGDRNGYVAVGNLGAPGAIWWSADGKTWRRVATAAEPDAKILERFTGVVHGRAGWIAVGYRLRPPAPGGVVPDAILWTSPDGKHWTKDARDLDAFEHSAQADGIGITADGVAIFGWKLAGDTTRAVGPFHQQNVLWLGSSTPPAKPAGIIEGTLEEIGGPRPLLRPVPGTVTITDAGGHAINVPVGADGSYSTTVKPGTYAMVGHSPEYQDGKYACGSRLSGSDMEGDPVIVRGGGVAHVDLECQVR